MTGFTKLGGNISNQVLQKLGIVAVQQNPITGKYASLRTAVTVKLNMQHLYIVGILYILDTL